MRGTRGEQRASVCTHVSSLAQVHRRGQNVHRQAAGVADTLCADGAWTRSRVPAGRNSQVTIP